MAVKDIESSRRRRRYMKETIYTSTEGCLEYHELNAGEVLLEMEEIHLY